MEALGIGRPLPVPLPTATFPHQTDRPCVLPRPQVFVGGNHVGGCDDTVAAYNSGKLKTLLEAAGVKAKL